MDRIEFGAYSGPGSGSIDCRGLAGAETNGGAGTTIGLRPGLAPDVGLRPGPGPEWGVEIRD